MTRPLIASSGLAMLASTTLGGCAVLPASAPPDTAAAPARTPPWRIEPLQQVRHALEAGKPQATTPADRLHRQALLLAAAGSLDAAIAQLQQAVRLAPRQAAMRNNLGFLLMQSGRADEARPHLLAALEIDPSMRRAQVNLERLPAPASPAAPDVATPGAAPRETPEAAAAASPGLSPDPRQAEARLRIVNGNGRAGAAARLGRWLGLSKARLSNLGRFDADRTEIGYRPGHADRAQALARQMPVPVRLREMPDLGEADVRIVVGRDLQDSASPAIARKGLARMPAGSSRVSTWKA